ncbi:hypothetical protein ACL6C3_16435 [Capilliphycus salinus ALCB114379]|uniref:hypothetical protein n=1 Tax=Capilliphycus salinus TaxID=2768948 RepID=UPI0039A75EDC
MNFFDDTEKIAGTFPGFDDNFSDFNFNFTSGSFDDNSQDFNSIVSSGLEDIDITPISNENPDPVPYNDFASVVPGFSPIDLELPERDTLTGEVVIGGQINGSLNERVIGGQINDHFNNEFTTVNQPNTIFHPNQFPTGVISSGNESVSESLEEINEVGNPPENIIDKGENMNSSDLSFINETWNRLISFASDFVSKLPTKVSSKFTSFINQNRRLNGLDIPHATLKEMGSQNC